MDTKRICKCGLRESELAWVMGERGCPNCKRVWPENLSSGIQGIQAFNFAPDPEHVIALALAGKLPEAQTEEILANVTFRPTKMGEVELTRVLNQVAAKARANVEAKRAVDIEVNLVDPLIESAAQLLDPDKHQHWFEQYNEWKVCTCGSGGHPRYCKRHPDRKALHIAEWNMEILQEQLNELKAKLAQLVRDF
jgi:hypothetical protein